MSRSYRAALFAMLCALGVLTSSSGSCAQPSTRDWPRWRGAGFDGAAKAGGVFDRPFALKVRWKTAIGAGYSGVVVAGGQAVTMASDGRQDYLIGLNARTGQVSWRVPVGEAFPSRDGSTGGPVSTPAIDGETVYALGPYGRLLAVHLRTGKVLWTRELVKELGAEMPHWGFTTSPLVSGDLLLVMTGGTNQALTAFNRKTGATVWRTGTDAVNYGSPVLAQVDGRQVVMWGGDTILSAVDPRDGSELWRYEHGGGGFYSRIVNPVQLAPGEFLLTNKPDEAVALRVSATAKPVAAWTTRELKLNYATPVTYGSHVYGYSGAFLTCVDAKTGGLAWRSRAPGNGWPIIVDGHLVVVTREGRVSVGEATPKTWEEKAGLNVFERLVWTPPSFADGRIYARDSYSEIAAIDIAPAEAVSRAATNPMAGKAPGSRFSRWVAETEGKADAAVRVRQFLAQQKSFPIIEGERYAHIVYEGDEADVAVRADPLEFVQELPMHRVAGTNLRYFSFELNPDARVTYHLVKNLTERTQDAKNPLQIGSLFFAQRASLLLMPRAQRALPRVPAAGLRGKVVPLEIETQRERAETLSWGGKRKIWVYLPPEYDADPSKRYPTLYVLKGEDMLNEGHLEAAIDQEIGKTLRPMVVVFVQETNAYEYARTFRAVFRKMMVEQLVPWIDGQFRTMRDARERGLLGGDEGGFGALEIGLHQPDVFGKVLAQSGYPLGTHDKELYAFVERSANKGQEFYLDWGVYDSRRRSDQIDVPGFMRQMSERLRARGYKVTSREFSDGGATALWAERVQPALREMFGVR